MRCVDLKEYTAYMTTPVALETEFEVVSFHDVRNQDGKQQVYAGFGHFIENRLYSMFVICMAGDYPEYSSTNYYVSGDKL
jgi:hypothetical protein